MLLILRGHEPGKGLWSVPGGRIEPGESDAEAVIREVREETGLDVTCGPLLGAVDRPGLAGAVIEIRDYYAFVTAGDGPAGDVSRRRRSRRISAAGDLPRLAGDDAADARWVTPAEAAALDAAGHLTPGLLAALRSWGAVEQ